MIRFSDKQWDVLINNYRKWWKGELGRPILPLIISGADPGRPMPKAPSHHFSNCADFSLSVEEIIDRMDFDLSSLEFYGDSFPLVRMAHFGPGVMAAFLGARLEPAEDTVWFYPPKKVPIEDLHFSYDESNIYFNRIKDIYRAGMKKWGGNVCMAMIDIGGGMDVLASMLGTEELLIEVLDNPKEVKRLCLEITEIWLKYYWELNDIIKGQRVFSDWSSRPNEKPSYILQCDFCYMISTKMFNEFVYDDLSKTSSALDKAFYHLDGKGALPHLDTLLSIDTIKGIQWVPGSGEGESKNWDDIIEKISKAGKKVWPAYKIDPNLDKIIKVVKKPDDLYIAPRYYSMNEKKEGLKLLEKYGAMPS